MPRPPIISIVGRKHSGKTTLVVRLAAALGRRGHRVMTMKHGSHTFNIDPESTDTYRHYHEGEAERVAMVAPDKFALVMRWSQELSPEAVAEKYLADADVIVAEGFTGSPLMRVEIFRRAAHDRPRYASDDPSSRHYLAIVTDDPGFRAAVPVLLLSDADWLDRLVELVERSVMHSSS